MCGIFAILSNKLHFDQRHINDIADKLKHRGPDSTGYDQIEIVSSAESVESVELTMVHTRLQINGDTTSQPLFSQTDGGAITLVINGEIFNWRELEQELDYTCEKSDCEIIIPLYQRYRDDLPTFFNKLDGQFSFCLYDKITNKALIARDRIGVTPLYYGTSAGTFAVASEMKALDFCQEVGVFQPRHYIYATPAAFVAQTSEPLTIDYYYDISRFYTDTSLDSRVSREVTIEPLPDYDLHKSKVRELLTAAVQRQVADMFDNPNCDFGVLLSGGLDSSLVASLVVKTAKAMGYTKPIKTFSVGVTPTAPDIIAAQRVAAFLGTDHHAYTFSIEEGINALSDVIYYTETYDCTSVRASTPMYLLTKKIKRDFPRLKVLFSGELSDELFCYLYGANAPTLGDFQNETVDLVSRVHQFDCLRANKTCMAASIEARVPFTDPAFVDYVLGLSPEYKAFGPNGRMEKQILRDAFDDNATLPRDILYRKKEQFSDGVSGFNGKEDNWIDAVVDFANSYYTDYEFLQLQARHLDNTPDTKEKLYYRELFIEMLLNNPSKTIHDSNMNMSQYSTSRERTVSFWYPKWSATLDPSGRVQSFWKQN
jgi:asparagine synthase (glutamine-hydrolysing)